MDALGAEPGECALVGDSVTDIQAARLARVHSIGYANEPGEHERFTEAGVGAIINSLADLALGLRARMANPANPVSIRSCYSFLYGFKGAPSARQADRSGHDRSMCETCTKERWTSRECHAMAAGVTGSLAAVGGSRARFLSRDSAPSRAAARRAVTPHPAAPRTPP